jgi:hypothetical protein
MTGLIGCFQYRGFCTLPAGATTKPQLAAPRAPPSELDVTTGGSVVWLQNDPAEQPAGASGPFILYSSDGS